MKKLIFLLLGFFLWQSALSQSLQTQSGTKKLIAGTGISLSSDATGITITNTASGGGGVARFSLEGQWELSSTKTNIGASFVNIYTQTNSDGKSISLDTNGKDSVMLTVNWNKVGSGTQSVEVTDGTNQLITMNVVSGFNTVTTAIPPAFQSEVGKVWLRAKSTTAADDPIFEGAAIYLK